MTDNEDDMAGILKRLVPKRFRKTELIIPVVRMHGAIMADRKSVV